MQLIQLTQGKVTLVDDADFELLNQFKWQAFNNRGKFYASRFVNDRAVLMHNVILPPPEGFRVDHRDRDGLNNQRFNLRHCTHAQNCHNQGLRAQNTSGFKGVVFESNRGLFRAQIHTEGRTFNLGRFQTAIEAAQRYDEKAISFFGEFAATNASLGLL